MLAVQPPMHQYLHTSWSTDTVSIIVITTITIKLTDVPVTATAD